MVWVLAFALGVLVVVLYQETKMEIYQVPVVRTIFAARTRIRPIVQYSIAPWIRKDRQQ
jgi:hypothetical protein